MGICARGLVEKKRVANLAGEERRNHGAIIAGFPTAPALKL
jgi:hypothetical protein